MIVHINKLIKEKNRYKNYPISSQILFRQKQLNKNSALKVAFEVLTPGRQRGYLLFFSAAKQSATREARIEKCIDKIMDGVGLND